MSGFPSPGNLRSAPKDWTRVRLKFAVDYINEKVDFAGDGEYVALENISSWTSLRLTSEAPLEPSSQTNRFQSGDVLFGKLRPYLAKVLLANFDGYVSSECLVLRGKAVLPEFVRYWCLSKDFIDLVDGSTFGSKMPRADWDFIGNTVALIPPLSIQRAIAVHLDRETAKIDTLIGKKRELITKLKEQRSALISRTVTRGLPPEAAQAAGLDPNPPMKDSGVEWLGEVPAHWSVSPLGYLVDMFGGGTPDKSNPDYWDGDIPWVSAKDMKTPFIQDSEDHISGIALASSAASLVPTGSILIVVRGMILLHTFPVALTLAEVSINQDMKALVCGASISPKFLFWAISGAANHLVASADEAAHGTKKIDTAVFKRLELAFPTIPEQVEVVKYLDNSVASLDILLARIETAITRLTEYRAALITAAVTGQLVIASAG